MHKRYSAVNFHQPSYDTRLPIGSMSEPHHAHWNYLGLLLDGGQTERESRRPDIAVTSGLLNTRLRSVESTFALLAGSSRKPSGATYDLRQWTLHPNWSVKLSPTIASSRRSSSLGP